MARRSSSRSSSRARSQGSPGRHAWPASNSAISAARARRSSRACSSFSNGVRPASAGLASRRAATAAARALSASMAGNYVMFFFDCTCDTLWTVEGYPPGRAASAAARPRGTGVRSILSAAAAHPPGGRSPPGAVLGADRGRRGGLRARRQLADGGGRLPGPGRHAGGRGLRGPLSRFRGDGLCFPQLPPPELLGLARAALLRGGLLHRGFHGIPVPELQLLRRELPAGRLPGRGRGVPALGPDRQPRSGHRSLPVPGGAGDRVQLPGRLGAARGRPLQPPAPAALRQQRAGGGGLPRQEPRGGEHAAAGPVHPWPLLPSAGRGRPGPGGVPGGPRRSPLGRLRTALPAGHRGRRHPRRGRRHGHA